MDESTSWKADSREADQVYPAFYYCSELIMKHTEKLRKSLKCWGVMQATLMRWPIVRWTVDRYIIRRQEIIIDLKLPVSE